MLRWRHTIPVTRFMYSLVSYILPTAQQLSFISKLSLSTANLYPFVLVPVLSSWFCPLMFSLLLPRPAKPSSFCFNLNFLTSFLPVRAFSFPDYLEVFWYICSSFKQSFLNASEQNHTKYLITLCKSLILSLLALHGLDFQSCFSFPMAVSH